MPALTVTQERPPFLSPLPNPQSIFFRRWRAHREANPRLSFGLYPTGHHRHKLGDQALAYEPQPQGAGSGSIGVCTGVNNPVGQSPLEETQTLPRTTQTKKSWSHSHQCKPLAVTHPPQVRLMRLKSSSGSGSKGCWNRTSSTRGKLHARALQERWPDSWRVRPQGPSTIEGDKSVWAHRATIHQVMVTGNRNNVHMKCGMRTAIIQQVLWELQDHRNWVVYRIEALVHSENSFHLLGILCPSRLKIENGAPHQFTAFT